MFYDTSMSQDYPSWINSSDHCSWNGIECNEGHRIVSLALEDIQIDGAYPQYLTNLDAITSLALSGNNLTGIVSDNICSRTMYLSSDELNCPNTISFLGDCCDAVKLASSESTYLNGIVRNELGNSDCSTLDEVGGKVCSWIKTIENHDVFTTYPYATDIPYDNWVMVRVETV